jgi:phosphate transport system protein
LLSALRISRELERIGDYAKNVAKHSITLDHLKLTGEEQRVLDMGHAVNTMLEEVIEAYNDQDINKAELVRDQDQDIDELFTKIFSDLLKINENNAHLASACSHLLFIARGFERIGDHATDIAEEVIFLVKGEFPEDDRVKADFSASIDG